VGRGRAKTIDCHSSYSACLFQEVSSADKEDAGGVPRTLEVELKGDLVDCCSAGDVVTLLGLVKVVTSEAKKGGPSSGHYTRNLSCSDQEAMYADSAMCRYVTAFHPRSAQDDKYGPEGRQNAGGKQNEKCLFLLYLEAMSVVTSRGSSSAPAQPASTW